MNGLGKPHRSNTVYIYYMVCLFSLLLASFGTEAQTVTKDLTNFTGTWVLDTLGQDGKTLVNNGLYDTIKIEYFNDSLIFRSVGNDGRNNKIISEEHIPINGAYVSSFTTSNRAKKIALFFEAKDKIRKHAVYSFPNYYGDAEYKRDEIFDVAAGGNVMNWHATIRGGLGNYTLVCKYIKL